MGSVAAKLPIQATRKVIVVTSNKGGTGKTTTSINLACAAAHQGWNVCAVDLDVQHNLDRWQMRRARYAAALPKIHVYSGRLEYWQSILNRTTDHEITIVDTPPGLSEDMEAIQSLNDMADFVLVPVQTGVFDLETTMPWLEKIKAQKKDKVAFILNRVKSTSSEVREAQSHLLKRGRVCTTHIRELISIQRSMKDGHSIVDSVAPGEKGKQDYMDVWNWIEREVGL